MKKLRIALLCNYSLENAATITDNIFGIRDHSIHEIIVVKMLGDLPSGFNIDDFDGLIIHYSLIACYDVYICPSLRIKIRNFAGVKFAFIQDEYRFINDTVNALKALKIHCLFTVVNKEVLDVIYPPEKLPGVGREIVLTGYVPENLLSLKVPLYQERGVDIGYRARDLPFWLGSFAREKKTIADKFLLDCKNYDLECDISCLERDRLYGNRWIDFIANTKAVLGVGSGASVLDFSGEIQKSVEAFVEQNPKATFERVRELFFKDVDGKDKIDVISPRCFEAAALRTLMIMYEGNYSGLLEAGRHYVVLERDHSNMDEVVRILKTPELAEKIIENTYREVACNPKNKFQSMVNLIDEVIEKYYKSVVLDQVKFTRNQYAKNVREKNTKHKKDLEPIGDVKKLLLNFIRTVKKIRFVFLKFYVNAMPFLAKSIIYASAILPSRTRESFISFLRRLNRRLIRKGGNSFKIEKEIYLWLSSCSSKNIFNYGIKHFLSNPLQFHKNQVNIKKLIDYVKQVKTANGVKVILLHDKSKGCLVVLAHEEGVEFDDPENYLRLNFKTFIEFVKEGKLDLSKIIWRAEGLEGVSKTIPFAGEKVFLFRSIENDKIFFLKLAKQLQNCLLLCVDTAESR